MPLLPVVYHHAPVGQPEPAPLVSPHVPRPVIHHPLAALTHVNARKMLIPWIIATDQDFGTRVMETNPQVAGGILGEFPGPLARPVAETHALPIQADDASPRRQPSSTARVGSHIVHSPQRLATNVGYALHAAALGKPSHTRAGQHQNRTIRLSLQTQNLIGRQAVLGGVHLKAAPIVGGKPPTERAEQQPSVRLLGNGHDRQIGQTVLEPKRIKPGAVEPADAAVGRGNPEKALAILVDVFHVHPGQPIKNRVLAAQHMLKGDVAHTRPSDDWEVPVFNTGPTLRYNRQ